MVRLLVTPAGPINTLPRHYRKAGLTRPSGPNYFRTGLFILGQTAGDGDHFLGQVHERREGRCWLAVTFRNWNVFATSNPPKNCVGTEGYARGLETVRFSFELTSGGCNREGEGAAGDPAAGGRPTCVTVRGRASGGEPLRHAHHWQLVPARLSGQLR